MEGTPTRRLSLAFVALLAAAVCAGLWGRLAGFGSRGLAVDELFFLRSAQDILAHGLPRLPDGGLYVVGLIPQYLTAASFALFGTSEMALRLPALLAGLGLPALAYRYARGHGSAVPAAAVAAALLLSSWQIEFSRFGRMYAIFSCATLLFLTRFDRSLIGPEWGRRYWTHGWAMAAALCHAEGALLAPLLFAPLLDSKRFGARRELLHYCLRTTAVVAVIAAFAAFDFRRLGVFDSYPAGYQAPVGSPLRLPAAALWGPGLSPGTTLIVIVAGLLGAVSWGQWRVRRGKLDEGGVLAALACTAGLLHQLLPAFVFAAALIVRSGLAPNRRRLAWIAACAAFWPAVAITTGTPLGPARGLFLGWPGFRDAIWGPWSSDLPWLGALIAAALAYSLWREGRRPWLSLLGSPAGIAAYSIAALSLLRYFYESTRYHYFLYPVLLTVVALASSRLLGETRDAVVFLALFGVAGDFDPRHIARAGSDEVALRLAPFQDRADLWYRRADYRGAAEALTRVAGPGSKVVIGTGEPVAFYFSGEYVRYLDRAEYPFWEQSRNRGRSELWTGQRLLSTAEELREWSAGFPEVLLVRRIPGDQRELDPALIWGGRVVSTRQEFRSRDGGVDIVRVALAN